MNDKFVLLGQVDRSVLIEIIANSRARVSGAGGTCHGASPKSPNNGGIRKIINNFSPKKRHFTASKLKIILFAAFEVFPHTLPGFRPWSLPVPLPN